MHGRKTLLMVSSVPLFSTLHFPLSALVRHFKLKHLFIDFFSSAKATFDAISKTYSYLTPDLWKETVFTKSPYQVQYAKD